jgi:hypothetical protein
MAASLLFRQEGCLASLAADATSGAARRALVLPTPGRAFHAANANAHAPTAEGLSARARGSR